MANLSGELVTPARAVLSRKIQAGAEPIPGYRLLARLGRGNFGEVWKAEAPGGLHKAIKFVFGNLYNTDADDSALAVQELAALQHVQAVRHPFLLSLERYDIIDGRLVVVMELADRSLWDRLQECRKQGLPGIPREELFRCLEEAAEALDLMNREHGLQHLDIKPANLFLVHHHVKVADFGLVKDLTRNAPGDVGGTPAYAAPEVFRGTISRHSDQYSLAVVAQELLTGQRPFEGTETQLKARHLNAAPNLVPLSPGDRSSIARALSKNPEDRFPSCLDFVRALRGGSPGDETRRTIPRVRAAAVVEAVCPQCGFQGRAPADAAGRTVSCRRCATRFQIPEPATDPSLEIPDEIGLAPMDAEEAILTEVAVVVDATCARCGFRGHAPEKYLGRTLKCRVCSAHLVLGTPATGSVKKARPTLHGQRKA